MPKSKREARADIVTIREVYELIAETKHEINLRVDNVEDKVDGVSNQVSNINGRLMLIPFLISTAISIFFFIINVVMKKQ